MNNSQLTYVLITPARNEDAYIERTIQSVVAQTTQPVKWIIVSDGSTDRTDEIVQKYATLHSWIELVRMPERKERHFAGKAQAFNAGYERLRSIEYSIIGNLDADITFETDYIQFLLSKFQVYPNLGVAGTPFREGCSQYDYRFVSIDHVSGACQLFRRQCFESIGGYKPLPRGIDLIAVTTARMQGWMTRCFTERWSQHHRVQGTGMNRGVLVNFWSGYYDYVLGVWLMWQVIRSIYGLRSKPFFIGGFCLLAGYLWAMITRAERPVSNEIIAFRKKEAKLRLHALIKNLFTRRGMFANTDTTR